MSGTINYKIITIGESGVGKTCILRRFAENKFLKNHLATIGIDYRTKVLNINNKNVKLKIWDTAGQERYHNITSNIFKGTDGILLVFDITDELSFQKIQDWIEQIKSNLPENEIGIVLLGNKCDVEQRAVTQEQGEELAEKLDIKYFETSALNGTGINEAFESLTKIIMEKKNNNTNDPQEKSITITSKNLKKRKCCLF